MAMRFSASNAERLMACPASADLEGAIPGWVAPVVDDMAGAKGLGTQKHEYLEPIVALGPTDIEHFAKILTYIAALRRTRRFKVLIEEEVTAHWLQTKPKTKPDLVLYVQDEIHVVDYKWGAIEVPVVDNIQELYYAACMRGLAPKAKGVTLHILQPKLDVYEDWFASNQVIDDFMARAKQAEAKIINGDHTFGPSDHGCAFCPANPHSRSDKGRPCCPAMMQILYPKVVDEAALLEGL